jgi:hypothetical protein
MHNLHRSHSSRPAAAVLLMAAAWASCGGGRPPEPAGQPGAPPDEPKVVQFYASAGVVARGEQSLLCYGVEAAEAVRIEPGVERVHPSYSRCVPVTPTQTTTYTLTAVGKGGRTATAEATIQVVAAARPKPQPPRPPAAAPDPEPVIASFRTEKKHGPGDPLTLLCYEVHEAEAVAIEPGVLPRSGALRGCLGVVPERPTTYFLTAFGRGGKTVRRALTVNP